jgi:hypothetical protein
MGLREKGKALPWQAQVAKQLPNRKGKSKYKNEPVTAYGIKFRSKIELKFYKALRAMKLDFKYEHKVCLTKKTIIKNKGKIITRAQGFQQVKMFVDFYFVLNGVEYFLDTKGSLKHIDPVSKLKYKLLGFQLYEEKRFNSIIRFVTYDTIDGVIFQLKEILKGNLDHL